jgi:DNA-binding PucR family transcriptional regulator
MNSPESQKETVGAMVSTYRTSANRKTTLATMRFVVVQFMKTAAQAVDKETYIEVAGAGAVGIISSVGSRYTCQPSMIV